MTTKLCPTEAFPEVSDDLLARLDRPGPRYTSYPTVPIWSSRFSSEDYGRALATAACEPDRPLSLYVHIPFCVERCRFCACNVVLAPDPSAATPYLDLVEREIQLIAERLGGRRRFARLHWGGGTPTFLSVGQMARLSDAIRANFSSEDGAEIAVEIDPAVTTPEHLVQLRSLGFNRLSMGIQDFDPAVQNAVARIQPFAETRALFEQARALGFGSINADLIYGLPHQSRESWAATLDRVIELQPDRVAVFSFAWVPQAHPHQRRIDEAALPRGAGKLALLGQAFDVFVGAGFRAIGMDHFARPGDPLAQAAMRGTLWRDFQGYSAERAGETVAFGITGISAIGGAFAQNVRSRSRYRELLMAGRLPVERGMQVSDDDRLRSAIIAQLMCNFCIDLGADAGSVWGPELARLDALEAEGLLRRRGSFVTLTALGRVFVRNVAMVFDAHLAGPAADKTPRFSRTV